MSAERGYESAKGAYVDEMAEDGPAGRVAAKEWLWVLWSEQAPASKSGPGRRAHDGRWSFQHRPRRSQVH